MYDATVIDFEKDMKSYESEFFLYFFFFESIRHKIWKQIGLRRVWRKKNEYRFGEKCSKALLMAQVERGVRSTNRFEAYFKLDRKRWAS